MTYLLLDTKDPNEAARFSAALWHMAQSYGKKTLYSVPATMHPVTGDLAMTISGFNPTVSPDADVDPIVSFVPVDAQDDFRQALLGARGRADDWAAVFQAVPYFVARLMTRHQMETDGWFPATEEDVATGLSIEWPPNGAEWLQNLPMTGDVRTFDDVEYRSLIDNNVWSPDAYPQGWELVETPSGNEWRAGVNVAAGEQYTWDGKTYEVVTAHTTQDAWRPDKPGLAAIWTEVTT